MNVKVEYRLAAIRICIDHHAIAVLCKPAFTRDPARGQKQMAERILIAGSRLIQRIDVTPRYDQHMRRSLRAQIVERKAELVLENLGRLNLASGYFAKNAVVHFHNPVVKSNRIPDRHGYFAYSSVARLSLTRSISAPIDRSFLTIVS